MDSGGLHWDTASVQPSPEQSFARRMREARRKAKMTQAQLAAQLVDHGIDIDPTGITRMETGQRSPRLNETSAIAVILGIQLWDLIGPGPVVGDLPPNTIAEAEAAIEIITVELSKLDAEHAEARQEQVNARQRALEFGKHARDLDNLRVELTARRQFLRAAIEEMRKKQS